MLSVVIITKNEEGKIKTCLESVKWADEIIIADNGSMDKTLEIARKYTSKIFSFEGQDFAEIRNQAMKKTSGDWVLYVDADERVLRSLKDEIEDLISNSDHTAFAISRCNIIFGSHQKYGPFWPDWVIRLLKKDNFEGWVGKVHEYPKFSGTIGYTNNSLLHLTHRNIEQVVLKSLDWSKIDASLRLAAKHPPMTSWRFIRILFSELFNQGIKRKGFFSGTVATIDSLVQVFSMVITYIRLWEMQQPRSLDEVYEDIDHKLVEKDFTYP